MLALPDQRSPIAATVPAVEVLSAEKIFPDGTRALAPIALTIAHGEFVTLIGPSGCGKTTLLKLMSNLLEPSDGRLLWWRAGYDDVVSRGRQVAFVFQDPTLMPWARVAANVRLPLDLAGVPRTIANARAAAALARVGLGDFARHFPRQLSGGMKMRASIARGLVIDPDLLRRAVRRARRIHPQSARRRPRQTVLRTQAHHGLRHPLDLRSGFPVLARHRDGERPGSNFRDAGDR